LAPRGLRAHQRHLVGILDEWSIDDAADAHDILDYFEALEEEQNRKK